MWGPLRLSKKVVKKFDPLMFMEVKLQFKTMAFLTMLEWPVSSLIKYTPDASSDRIATLPDPTTLRDSILLPVGS